MGLQWSQPEGTEYNRGHGSSGSSGSTGDDCHNPPNNGGQPAQGLLVRGKVQNADGTPLAKWQVDAVDVDLRTTEKLGTTHTSTTGEYEIRYTSKQFARKEKGTADIRVSVTKPGEASPSKVAAILFNAPNPAVINVVVDGDAVVGPSEWKNLSAVIQPLLGDLDPADLTEDDKNQDLSFLAGETGFDQFKIQYFTAAHQLQNQTKVPAEMFYGLFRENLPVELSEIIAQPEDTLTKAIKSASSDNIISAQTDDQAARYASQLHALGISSVVQDPTTNAPAPTGSVLSTVTDHADLFIQTYASHNGSIESFWDAIGSKPEFQGKVSDLQLSVQLGVATLSHAPLVKAIQARKQAGKISTFADLTTFSQKDWLQMIQSPGVGAPDIVPGETPDQKATKFAKGISRIVEDAFPTRFISSRLQDSDDDNSFGQLAGKSDVVSFLAKNPTFSFTSTRLTSYLSTNSSALTGVKDPNLLKSNVSSMQRLYRITGQYTQMRSLVNGGVNSSMQIVRMGPTAFAAKYSDNLGGSAEAARIFEIASQTHATATHLISNLSGSSNLIGIGKWLDPGLILGLMKNQTGIPDWSTLFGSQDLCSCSECRSTEGPAAYYVDILHFLQQRGQVLSVVRDTKTGEINKVVYKTRTDPNTGQLVEVTAKLILFDRRPDLGDIELTCQNTNTPLPYIDLANEILEAAVSPFPIFKPFKLPDSAYGDLDSQKLDNIKNSFAPALTDSALVTVIKQGTNWVIDDAAFSYSIVQAAGAITVTARSLQTKGTAADRAANTQYINIGAYNLLQSQVYPWKLPFNLWSQTVRTYLSYVGVGRYEIMETFASDSRANVLQDPRIVSEFLALTPFETKLVTGEISSKPTAPQPGLWNLWGFATETLTTSTGIPDPVDKSTTIGSGNWISVLASRLDIFLQQSGLAFPEVQNIMQLNYIFDLELGIKIRAREGSPVNTCDPSKLEIIGLTDSVLLKIVQLTRLSLKLGDWSILDTGKFFDAFRFPNQPQDMATSLMMVSHVRRLMQALSLPLEFVLSFWNLISSKKYHDYTNSDEVQPGSLYYEIFRNPTLAAQPDTVFTDDPSLLTGSLKANIVPVAAALGLSPEDLGLFLADTKINVGDAISIDSLSTLFRHTVLSKALSMQVRDYLLLTRLVSPNPFLSTLETVLFVERVNSAQQSPFSFVELNYLLRHDYTTDSGVSSTDDSLGQTLSDVRAGLRSIAADNTFDVETVDDKGDITKKKLALLSLDSATISQAVAILNNTASFSTPLATVPAGIVYPTNLQDKISYDSSSSRLLYSRVMITADRDALTGIAGAPADFIAAVNALYQNPRTFFARNLKTFSIPDFSTALSVLPTGVKIPASLKKKVYYDAPTQTLHSTGALSDTEEQLLISAAPATEQAFIIAVQNLYNIANSVTSQPGDEFITPADVSAWFDSATDSSGVAINPLTRFTAILQKLLPYVHEKLSNQFIRQKIGDVINVSSQVLENLLLKWLQYGGSPINNVFRASLFSESSDQTVMNRASFPDQYAALTLLIKVGTIISKFKFTSLQLNWIFGFRVTDDPTTAWLDLGAIPLALIESGIANFKGWERLFALTRVRDGLVGGQTVLDAIFAAARSKSPTALSTIEGLLATNMKLQHTEDLDFLIGSSGFDLQLPVAFEDEIALSRILRAMKLFRNAGCTPQVAKILCIDALGFKEAQLTKQSIKSKYDSSTWNTVAQPLSNILRDAQRASLVAYLLANPKADAYPPWRTSNDLLAYFLIDVEMGPCQMTSRIKQAISSVQLFAQRCIMNLEQNVKADTETDINWTQWTSWMKSFRIAGANRQVWEMPENLLDQSIRDDRTQFFTELETELQQTDIDSNSAETALHNYLEKLDAVSRMEIVSYYHQQEYDKAGNPSIDVIHIFARTKSIPHKYFYCQRVDGSYWTSWEKLDIDLQGDHLIPVMWNRRLYLFWALFTAKQAQQVITMPAANQPLVSGATFWEIKLAWTERKHGKWQPKTISDAYLICPKSDSVFEEIDMKASPGRTLVTFKAAPNPDTGELWIRCLNPSPLGYFYFNGIRGQPQIQLPAFIPIQSPLGIILSLPIDYFIYSVSPPTESQIKNMWFEESDGADGKVWTKLDGVDKFALLSKHPGSKYNLAIAHQDRVFQSQRPFWFQHDQRSFFVEPYSVHFFIPIGLISNPLTTNPGLLDGRLASKYYQTLTPKPLPIDIPRPDVAGLSVFAPSYEYESDLNGKLNPSLLPSTAITQATSMAVPSGISSTALATTSLAVPAGTSFLKGVTTIPVKDKYIIAKPTPILPIDISKFKFPVLGSPVSTSINLTMFKFSTFYHPYVEPLIKALNRDGIPGLYQRSLQLTQNDSFIADYGPSVLVDQTAGRPIESVDFDDSVYAVYNWELFYHVPVMIAERLSQNQKFADAQKWFHYVFDPTDTSSLDVPQRYWRTKKLFEVSKTDYVNQTIQNILLFLAKGGDPATRSQLSSDEQTYLNSLETNVMRWRENPFNPFMIARGRVTAFQKSVIMKYLDNLIAWGDSLFRGNTLELINEATQIYALAADILGPRPLEMTSTATPEVQTYNTLEPRIDAYGNALAVVEELVPVSTRMIIYRPGPKPQPNPPTMTYFCAPKNDKLLSYWDTVANRLYKIRHCMNIMGVVQQLPLFEPPIDPALLVRAAASGVDLSSAIGDVNAPLPYHRYIYLSSKAVELCQDLKSLGNGILAALEKKDAGELALLSSGQTMALLDAVRDVKLSQVDDTAKGMEIINKNVDVVKQRWNYYNDTPLVNVFEGAYLAMEGASLVFALLDSGAQPVTAVINLIPDAKLGAPTSIGVTFGGSNVGKSASKFAKFLQKTAVFTSRGAGLAAALGGYTRRKAEYDMQFNIADNELKMLQSQLDQATIKNTIAQKDLVNHDLQRTHAKDTDEFLHNKYTNVELYDWMLGQLSGTYFQTYQLVFDTAKRAERAFGYELGIDNPNFISFNYWDSMKKGLTAGERLFYDIKRMEMAYMEQDAREYELTRSISLAQLDPVALIQLRSAGSCFFSIPEAIYDLDYPGHYMRRIKSVSVTIPCVVGPYTSVASTLSLVSSSIRKTSNLSNGKYARVDNDIRFSDVFGQMQAIATSSGTNDSGLFEGGGGGNLRDERYLPFERSGAISSWKMEVPMAFRSYDYDTITDVVLTIRYTSREGGAALGLQASTELRQKALDAIAIAEAQNGLSRLFDVPREFPDIWYKFLRGTPPATPVTGDGPIVLNQEATLPFTARRFPYLFFGGAITISKIDIFIRIKKEYLSTHSADALTLTLEATPPVAGGTAPTPLVLSEWGVGQTAPELGKVFRVTKSFGKPLGNYYLTGSLNGGAAMIERDAVAQLLLVAHYAVKWV